MLSNAYFLAKFRFDAAENEPAKNLQKFANFAQFANPNPPNRSGPRRPLRPRPRAAPGARGPGGRPRRAQPPGRAAPRAGAALCFFIKLSNFCKFLAGSFSAVSKRNFARKYAFDSIFQALQDLHTFAPLQSQNFSKKSVWKISNFREISAKQLQMLQTLQNVCQISKISAR